MSNDNLDEVAATTETEVKRVGALKTLETLSEPADVEDIDPQSWLAAEEEDLVGDVIIGGKRLKIAALTEAEVQRLLRISRRPNPRYPNAPPELDPMKFRCETIALSLNKANPGSLPVVASQFEGRKAGTLTTITDAIMALSGMDASKATQTPSFFA